MEWEQYLNEDMNEDISLETIRRLCCEAYMEGCKKEKSLAVEAHRLQCHYLFGNRCMNHPRERFRDRGVCAGNCLYIQRYEFELYKLESV
ncbi:MAG: hypothetical protein NC410_04675 [Oscillibacter sp.]|nr:hypothetical protein [Oscillibacter sp.]